MKKLLLVMLIVCFLPLQASALKSTIMIPTTSDTQQNTSAEFPLGGADNSQKLLYVECTGTGTDIDFQVQVATTVDNVNLWATTYEFTLTEAAGVWTLTSGTTATVLNSMPFYLVTGNYMDTIRIQYKINIGTIYRVALITSQ